MSLTLCAARWKAAPSVTFGHVCYMNKVPFAIIRSISDDFKFNKPENYEEFSQLAADRTVKALKKFIQMD